jgi:hypothetical protein
MQQLSPNVAVLLCSACFACAGKTHLAQRLAQLYGLMHINTAAVLAELPFMDAEIQKVRTLAAAFCWGGLHCWHIVQPVQNSS